jgi:hypothetical protein
VIINFFGKLIFRISKLLLAKFGFVINLGSTPASYPELSKEEIVFLKEVFARSLTMTSFESLCTLAISCKHLSNSGIKGDFVEAGVWRGGSSIIAKHFLAGDRKFYLFDTYSGMTMPTEYDYRVGAQNNQQALARWESEKKTDHNGWVFASLEEVTKNFDNFKLLDSTVVFCKGDVRETLLKEPLPDQIALLRLDTDFYDSTLVELQVLWPRLVSNGILILDDYGHWDGARKAVDDYFSSVEPRSSLMTPIAGGGRLIVKK